MVDDGSARRLPLDPDVDPPGTRRMLLPVLAGGCVGGLARYAVTESWPTATGRFPWALLVVNCSGALLLAVLLVLLAAALRPAAWVRPLLGTGFCGAWTTFSAVVADADQLIAHGHALLGAGYVLASAVGGVVAAAAGLALGRALTRAGS